MAFNITQFTSEIADRGVSKESNFEVRLFFPQSLGGVDPQLSLRAESASIPGRTTQTIDDARDITGPPRKLGYTPIYVPMDVTFLVDEELEVKEKLESWMDIITGNHAVATPGEFNSTSPFNPGYYDDYVGTIEVVKLNERNTRTMVTRLIEAYPISLALLNLSWESEAVQKLQVQFQYRYYERKNITNIMFPSGQQNQTPIGSFPARPGPGPSPEKRNFGSFGPVPEVTVGGPRGLPPGF